MPTLLTQPFETARDYAAGRVLPALRDALVAKLRGLFHLDANQRLVADHA